MSDSVTPRRTGLVVFVSRLFSVFTGVLFLTMMTRNLSASQFGLWEFMLDVVVFAAYPTGLLTYWATRAVARNEKVGGTTIVSNLLASIPGLGLFLLISVASFEAVGSTLTPFLLGLILVPLTYWNQATSALTLGYNPSIGAYSLLVSEPAKVLVAYPLLYLLHLNLTGVILSIAVSYAVQAGASTYQLRRMSGDRPDFKRVREWLAQWHVPSIFMLNYVLGIADTFAASVGQGGTDLAGYYQAAYQIATLVSYATFLSVALYPLMLRRRSDRLPGEVLDFSLLFAIPMAAGAISLAPQMLFLLSPRYTVSSPALVVLVLSAVALLISTVFDQALTGRERADLAEVERTRSILRSDLMFVPLANLAFGALYVTSVFFVGFASAGGGSLAQFALYWAAAQLAINCVLAVVKAYRLRRQTPLGVPSTVLLYAGAATAMGLVVWALAGRVLGPSMGMAEYGGVLAAVVLVGAAVYFGILFAASSKVRGYVTSVLKLVAWP